MLTIAEAAPPTQQDGARVGSRTSRVLIGLGRSIVPVVVALVFGAFVLRVCSINPLATYGLMLENAFGSTGGLAGTLSSATPLLFTGLATAIAFRAGVFSMGAEAAFVLGGLTAAWLAVLVPGPPIAAIIVAAVGAVIVGTVYSYPAAWLKTRLGVDEVVSTLMLTFVAQTVAAWIVNQFLLAPGAGNSSTAEIPFSLTALVRGSTLNVGFIVIIVLVIAYSLFLRHTYPGFVLHQVGVNRRFASSMGMQPNKTIVTAMLATGAIAGLGGAVHAMGVVGRFVGTGFSADYGFTGVAIALLARRSALGLIPAAILFGAFANAGTTIQLYDNIPLDIVDVLQGTVMMLAVADLGIERLTKKLKRGKAQ